MIPENALKNKRAIVSGASRGIGRAIARKLHSLGAHVVGTATSEKGAKAISEFLGEGCGRVLDVSQTDSIESFSKAYLEEAAAPDILVNNAGITKDNILLRMREEEWEQVISTNLSSAYRMARVFARSMVKARYGRIINVGSVVASVGNLGQANYVASKAGLEGLTRAMALELGARNITVNAVAPGFIVTDMTDGLPEETAKLLMSRIPLARFGKPEEVADAVAFLASDTACYITGTVMHVNGGMYMN
jgi:3-oxoacyl-[acyl-carrier protein] reductase